MEIKFFVRIRGALTPPPRIEDPVMNIPLDVVNGLATYDPIFAWTYHAAPTTDRPMHKPIPRSAQTYGDIVSKNCPTYKDTLASGNDNDSNLNAR